MPDLNAYTVITALSGLIIISYVFSIISNKTRIPTVLMLLLLGIGLRELLIHLDMYAQIPLEMIQFFGVMGLILILLEAGLDLNMSRDKLPLVKRATASSLFVLILSTVGIASLIHVFLEQSWRVSFVYAIPLSVISSTIVASSIHYLSEKKREFLTYESSLSDIFGILLFNFLIVGESFNFGLIAFDVFSLVIAVVGSVIISIVLVFLLTRMDVNIKAFLVFASLMLIYSVGHMWHLPTLLTVLIFGLIVNNWQGEHFKPLHKVLKVSDVAKATETIRSVTSESAFLIRTVFFALFGYTINLHTLANTKVLLVGTAIVAIIFIVRYLYLRFFIHEHILPELFFAPRGLVTVVLFYSIPATLTFKEFDDGILFFVIVVTTIIMMVGSMLFTPHESTRKAEETSRKGLRGVFSHILHD